MLPGCLVLDGSTGWFSSDAAESFNDSSSNLLAKVPPPKTAVALEIVFVERPVDDPLLGSALWDEVDQIGSLPAANRQALADLGFRVGRVGANPPRALQTLMGLATEVVNEDDKRLVVRRVVLPSGAETEINTGSPRVEAAINVPTTEGMERKTFQWVRGVFRVKAKRLQEGWARIEFLPEIHHGRMTNRAVVVGGRWQSHTSQIIERLYAQRFSLDLNLGEMVILTGEAEPQDSLGRHFFHAAEFTGTTPKAAADSQKLSENPAEETASIQPGIQRLLIVRLADLSTAKPLFSE